MSGLSGLQICGSVNLGTFAASYICLATEKLCIHFVYKNCAGCIQLMYTKCIQNVSHILANFCIHFVAKFWQLNFLCKICANVCRNAGYNLYTFFRHHFSSTKSIHHKNCVYNLFKKFIPNVYINSCMQNGSHISTYFAPFVVNFLVNYCTQMRLGNLLAKHLEVSLKNQRITLH